MLFWNRDLLFWFSFCYRNDGMPCMRLLLARLLMIPARFFLGGVVLRVGWRSIFLG